MTLEEKISFYSRESASEFQKYLRSKECGSHISLEHSFTGEPFFEGTIPQFLNLIEILEKRDEADGETDDELAQTKNDLIERQNHLTEFFAAHKKGDILQNATPTQMMTQVQSIEAESDDAFRKDATDKFVLQMMILATLEDNDLLTESDNGKDYVLTNILDANELRIMYAYTDFPAVTSEDLQNCGLASHIRTSSVTDYVVTVGSEILFTEPDDLADFLDDADIDEEESAKFIDAIFFKQAFVGKIHDLIEAGNSSEEKLLEALSAPAFPLEGSNDVISFDISPEYLTAVLSDMRKLGIITGKDGKLKNT
ncbi:MAG TPA: hypothetical protein O0X27_03655 [Methanocorpusculum sp.]|nr:hypothetical protein [Methanocorpusculum sp.]